MSRSLVAGALAGALGAAQVLGATPASARGGETHWDSRAWEVNARMSAEALTDRPDWADQQVRVESPVVWVVAVLPIEDGTWNDRLLAGTRQAEVTLFDFADYLVRAQSSEDPVDYQDRQLVSVRHRLKASFDREGFIKVETLERPNAVWMRFGYPAAKLETALGFTLPGAIAAPPRRPAGLPGKASGGAKAKAAAASEPPPSVWDYVWETAWLGGVTAVTAAAVLFAQAAKQ